MLIVIDVGNTNTVLGLFDGKHLLHDWRIRTEIDHTIDEYGVLIYNLYLSTPYESQRDEIIVQPLLFRVSCRRCSIFWSLSASSILTSNRSL